MVLEQLKLLRHEHCDVEALENSETSTLCGEKRQMSVLATEDICPVSAADISSVTQTDICLDVSDVSIAAMSQCPSLR